MIACLTLPDVPPAGIVPQSVPHHRPTHSVDDDVHGLRLLDASTRHLYRYSNHEVRRGYSLWNPPMKLSTLHDQWRILSISERLILFSLEWTLAPSHALAC